MNQRNLEQFEHKLVLRQMRVEDYDSLIEMQKLCFPGMTTWARDQIETQLEIFPDGQFCIDLEGKLVASCSTLIVRYEEYDDWHNWTVISDNGYIRNHDPSGDVVYGIEIMVHPEYRGMRLARRLYDARKQVAMRYNARSIIICGRIPGYAAHSDKLSAREYVDQVTEKQLFDPVLTTQVANGFVLKGLIADYFPSDSESRGYATHLEWTNLDRVPDHRRRILRRVDPVRLAVVQYSMRPVRSFDAFARQSEFFVDAGADQKADFLVFPELFTTQLMSLAASERLRAAESARALAGYTADYLELFSSLAVKYNVNIVGGSHFAEEEGRLYNVAYLFRRDGTLDRQTKIHITPDERRWWGVQAGDTLRALETDHGKVAILLGYDVEFPELGRIAAQAGARVFFVPYNTADRSGHLRIRYSAQARCVENHVYVATAGVVGNLPFVQHADIHYAQSGIYTPCDISFARDGIAAECTPNIETVLVQDLDFEALRRLRQRGTETNWLDRRHDVYRLHYRPGQGEEVEI